MGRGLFKEVPKKQAFRPRKPDVVCSLHCLGTQHPSLPVSLYSYLTDTHLGNRGFARRRAAKASKEWRPFFFLFYSRHNSSHCPLYYERNYLKPNSEIMPSELM